MITLIKVSLIPPVKLIRNKINTLIFNRLFQSLSSKALAMFFKCFYSCFLVKREYHHLLPYVHYDSRASHLTRIISEIVKRLKDPDAEARDDCRDMIGALSRIYLKGDNADALVDLFVKPLFEAMGERSKVVQSGAAMCMARMVASAASPPITCFQNLCPRICKLLSNPTFSAKASLLPVVSSLSQVGAIAPQSMELLLESIHDCLASMDWVTRKAAADTLTALASHSSSLIKDKTDFTIDVFDNCWFDKIQPVRESVTEALQLWKKISVKCVDSKSKISAGEQDGNAFPDVKFHNLESHGGTCGGNKAVVNRRETPGNHAAAVSNTDNQSEAIQRQLFQLERQRNDLMNVLQEFIGGSHDIMVTLEGKVWRSQRISDDTAKDEATLEEAVRLAGEDGAVSRPTAVPEAEAMGGEKTERAGTRPHDTHHTSFENAY